MKHIRQVRLQNFQSHADSSLTFGPGLNAITGPSDNGKSAVLRAIRWALYNEPRGSEFVRMSSRECRVTVAMSDGAEIVRELFLSKSGAPSRSRYIVTLPGGEPQAFEGFGVEVPPEVTAAHGMAEILLDTDKRVLLSYGSQLEGPFLMAETGSVRARAIGRLLGVHVVDAAVRETQRDLKNMRAEAARLERELQHYDAELAAYEDLPEQESRLAESEALLSEAEALGGALKELQAIASQRAAMAQQEDGVLAELARTGGELAGMLAEYGALLKQSGRCPTCMTPLSPAAVAEMVANLSAGSGAGHRHEGARPADAGEGGQVGE